MLKGLLALLGHDRGHTSLVPTSLKLQRIIYAPLAALNRTAENNLKDKVCQEYTLNIGLTKLRLKV